MPDTFKILQESFSDPVTINGDGEFHDFNALSRIAAAEPAPEAVAPRSSTPEQSAPTYRKAEEVPVSSFSSPAQSATPSDEVVQTARDHARSTANSATSIPPGDVRSVAPQPSRGEKGVADAGWRELPLSDLFGRLRSRASVGSETAKRLHGMFRH